MSARARPRRPWVSPACRPMVGAYDVAYHASPGDTARVISKLAGALTPAKLRRLAQEAESDAGRWGEGTYARRTYPSAADAVLREYRELAETLRDLAARADTRTPRIPADGGCVS